MPYAPKWEQQERERERERERDLTLLVHLNRLHINLKLLRLNDLMDRRMNGKMEEILLDGWKVGFIVELRDKFKSWKHAFFCKAETCKSSDVLISLGSF
jgi:hypothetical protein